ncbi:pitrilysin family protein [Micromonospora sp. NPDC023888]|uniref:M16 family metallopeptidase n=1 Tax=Micromonospora sp. NPDC023888 TaxID=3155607 RepID=UPI00340089E3
MRRLRLDNGLRVVLARAAHAPIVAVAVHYDVGFRSEPPGLGGFAHLFEHLMFQGADGVDVDNHLHLVEACGGSGNATTQPDFTEYFQIVPAHAIERVLFLEAARMRAPRLTAEALRVQTAVVREEIRTNVLARPYGGFPWTRLPSVLYRTHANGHDGYGDVANLERATVADCHDFHDRYYAPTNAVLTIVGAFDEAEVLRAVQRHFGVLAARPRPPVPNHAEPASREDRVGEQHDPTAPLPALAVGYRLPPATQLDRYVAAMLLACVLGRSEHGVLSRRLVVREQVALALRVRCGLFAPMQARDPDTFSVVLTHRRTVDPGYLLDAVDEALAGIAAGGPIEDEVDTARRQLRLGIWRADEDLVKRARRIGGYEVLFGRPELIDEVPARLATAGGADVAAAAAGLRAATRGVLRLVPEASS